MTDMEKIAANMENSDDLTLDDIREVLRLMQQEGFFDLLEKSSTPPLQEGMLGLANTHKATPCIRHMHYVRLACLQLYNDLCARAPVVCEG